MSLIGSSYLNVYLNEEEVKYIGPLISFAFNEDLHLDLDPGQSITIHIAVNKYYDLSAPGHYMVSVSERSVPNDEPMLETFLSLPVIEEGKKGFSIWNKIAFWQKPRSAGFAKSNTIVLDLS